jgi:site-specific DNA-methyltransferase (adenine-specific)
MVNCNLIHGDCLEEMQKLINDNVKVDLILTDPPYGNIKGLTLRETANFRKELTQWDNVIPIKPMFDCCYELLNDNRNLLLFCDGAYSFDLYHNQYVSKLPYLYKYYWMKQNFANQMGVNRAPVNYIEEIFVFKKINSNTENQELREYAKKLWRYIDCPRAEIDRRMGDFRVNHFFRFNGIQFSIPSREAYNDLTRIYNLKEYHDYKDYDELLELKETQTNFFKLKKGDKFKSNVLKYNKIYHGSVHPTQKPVDLLEDLICTYTNPHDTVLDFTMGSGSTGVACLQTNRNFIGIELDENYYNIAKERCKSYQSKLTME